MKTGWSERIREMADREYVNPARGRNREIQIQVGELQKKLKTHGFPPGYTNQILTSLESERFWKERGLEMDTPAGQPRRHETVLRFHFLHQGTKSSKPATDSLLELSGILKGAIREGADAFVRELRRDKASSR